MYRMGGDYMELSIQALGRETDEATKCFLQNIVDRKVKFDRLERKEKHAKLIALFSSLLFLLYILYALQSVASFHMGVIVDFLFGTSYHLMAILFIAFLYGYGIQLNKKREKAEKEYHDLRCELIKKSTDLWPTEERWEARQHVFKVMKEQFGVNLYHENK